MQLYIIILLVVIIIFLLLKHFNQRPQNIEINDALLSYEELIRHAKETAKSHRVYKNKDGYCHLFDRLDENFNYITDIYRKLNEYSKGQLPLCPASEWLLDNYYIIEEQYKGLKQNKDKKFFKNLNVLKDGYLKDYPRIFAIALELAVHTDGKIDEEMLINFVKAYQSINTLSMAELWALSPAIKIALFEKIKFTCEKIYNTQLQWNKAEKIKYVDEENIMMSINKSVSSSKILLPSFIERVVNIAKYRGINLNPIMDFLEEYLLKFDTCLDNIIKHEHQEQAEMQIAMGNSITSLRINASINWEDIFESLSIVEGILKQDPSNIYPQQDFMTRDYYRHRVEKIAKLLNVSETSVARAAIECAEKGLPDCTVSCHVGYYLSGKGVNTLLNKLGTNKPLLKDKYETPYIYILPIVTMTIVFSLLVSYVSFIYTRNYTVSLVILLLSIIPFSDVAISLTNWIITHRVKPDFIPKLEMKYGIPDDKTTLVIVPTILPDVSRVKELISQLEVTYLANKEDNMYFALVGDFKDNKEETSPNDQYIVDTALHQISELNKKYAKDIFFFFCRKRIFNKKENKWMAWERKRGAIVELNNLIRGDKNTTFSFISGDISPLKNIKYIITLDADTIMPIGTARKLIGTIAHPLNEAIVDKDKGIVTGGYGLIQPRIAINIESSNKTLFSRIFAGCGGVDPYSSAVSDVYQDLFGEGIFTGKGIYNVDVYREVLNTSIPDNTILSHDLLEGSYLRVGLATDIQLYDGYPEKYSSYILRLHRWVRGDWQLIKWLFPYVKNRFGERHKNTLTPLSKWKIFDNLRRSLVSTNNLLLVSFALLTITRLPLWLILVFISPILFHLILGAFDYIILKYYKAPRQRLNGNLIYGFKAALLQGLLNLTMLPYHAYMMLNAILKTLYRVFISKNNLLEWVTAAEVEKNLKNDFNGFVRRMYSSVVFSLLLLIGILILRPTNILYAFFFTGLWAISPYIAFYISKPVEKKYINLTEDELKHIREISLKTWYFYEEFSGEDNHFLPVDNYQETPVSRVAHRTSPTNIGFLLLSIISARDLGYISLTSTIKKINNTITTIEKMEKWNGHLYNWYDTKSLEVLHPRYVSTVDSGNLVGYYITLIEGLEDILKTPILNSNILKGIIDILEHSEDYNKDLLKELNHSFSEKIFTPKFYFEIFEKIKATLNEDDNHDIKLKSYIDELLLEVNNLYPSILYKIDSINFINNHDEFKQLNTIIEAINSNSSPVELSKIYESTLSTLNLMLDECEDSTIREFLLLIKPEVIRVSDNLNSLIHTTESVKERVQKLCDETLFKPLYDEKRGLFSIGYNVDENKLTESYYDLLASEARLTSYIAAVRGEVPVEHWFRLGRALTLVDGFRALVSWTGTMFEYFMPALIMKNFNNTLLDETYETAIKSQIKYGNLRHLPWGTSESGYYTFDLHLNYQYKAFGVPELGLKRGLIRDMVISPYSTLLALPFAPKRAIENIKRLISLNLEGEYGLYEAADFTPERLGMGNDYEVVKSYMAHHQGMIMLSINNFINNNIMIKRFHSNPLVRCGEFMLHEKTPLRVIITKEYKETVEPFSKHEYEDIIVVRNISSLDNPLPVCHMLSNGSYSVLLTNGGSGYSKNGDIQVTRWREDSVSRKYGSFIFIRELNSNKVWSSTFEPINKNPDYYNVKFSQDKAEYHRTDGNIETHHEICVSPEDNCEIRKITIKNNGEREIIIECTSYNETVLSPQMADIAHPAFNNLFIRTEYIKEMAGIISSRRPREEHKETLWAYHSLTVKGNIYGDYEFETNRNKFIGRGRDISNPLALNHPLSGTIGPVLDPIMSLRGKIIIEPGKSAVFSFTTGTARSKEEAKDLISKYHDFSNIERAFELAYMRSQMELKYLNLSPDDIETYDNMISHILFLSPIRKKFSQYIVKNKKGQSGLWAYGISGDVPIVLVTIKKTEDIEVIKDMLSAHDYWRSKGLKVDLVILNEDESSYLQPLEHLLREVVLSTHARNIMDRQGGIFIRNAKNMPEEDVILLYSVSRLIIKAELGQVKKQIELNDLLKPNDLAVFSKPAKKYSHSDEPLNLLYFNGYGGFDVKSNEYVIRLKDNINTPAPWINVVANESYGFIVTESGSGYTWCENSRENKLTPWSNDPVSDTPSEIIYIRDDDTGEVWTITPLPIREKESYTIRHGFGYSLFNHNSHGINQNLTVFVPKNNNIKISLVKLENNLNEKRKLSIYYYIRPVLGVSEQITQQHLISEFDAENDCILIKNPYNADFPEGMVFVDSSLNKISYTCDRLEFLGQYGHLYSPQALKFEKLSNSYGAGFDTCCVLQNSITLEAGNSLEFVYLLGQIKEKDNLKPLLTSYKNINTCKKALNDIKDFWGKILSVVNVETPDTTMNLMLNSWLLYQTLVCRIWARSAFYQSGGAYGYRDQLQDVMSLMYSMPSIARKQILLHCAHQFVEGDVQHWWHPGAGDKGIRTRFSDDLVWLPYVTSEYVKVTGDFEVLKEIVHYLEDDPLKEGEDERYGTPRISQEKSSVYEHCVRAIERSLKFGEHGIPLMGSGDWNDGMSTVGNKGKGESVWLGWFIYTTLSNFIPICKEFKDFERADKYLRLSKQIIESIEKNAWDGEWYRRAYFDDGTPLGSSINTECKIDSLAQSWAAISDAADKERVLKAMSSVENYLIKEEAGLILLFTPPFDEGNLRPGYIRGYVPGVRENGGQYTHASTWVIYAFAKLGYGDKAHQYFNLINPINHSITQMDCSKYKVEPYVVAADVYSIEPHTGRGGWTWYTGSSGWMYRVGLEQILGFKKQGNKLMIDPCIPKEWREFKIYYKFGETKYNITVVNPVAVNRGVKSMLVDNKESNFIDLKDDKNEHNVVVTLG